LVGVFLLEVPLYGKSTLQFGRSTVKWTWLVECADEHWEWVFFSIFAYQIALQNSAALQI